MIVVNINIEKLYNLSLGLWQKKFIETKNIILFNP